MCRLNLLTSLLLILYIYNINGFNHLSDASYAKPRLQGNRNNLNHINNHYINPTILYYCNSNTQSNNRINSNTEKSLKTKNPTNPTTTDLYMCPSGDPDDLPSTFRPTVLQVLNNPRYEIISGIMVVLTSISFAFLTEPNLDPFVRAAFTNIEDFISIFFLIGEPQQERSDDCRCEVLLVL